MIDFRYHLVSLISVFLALAVGIVLGAGPLRENLGDQLAGQVEQLRTEQDQLRSQADELGIQNDQLASFITEIGPDLVADTLPGNDIAILTDDSSTRPATERTSELLEEAGAQSVTRVDLQPALWEPDEDDRRTEAISAISAIAPGALDTELEGSEQLSAVIVTLLAPAAEDSDLDPELRAQIWQILVDHQLVTLTGDMPPQVDGVIFASAAPEDLAEESEDDTAATERAQGLLASQTALVDQLAVGDLPAVVAGATPHNDSTTSLLRTVRGDSELEALSTTDRLEEADGPVLSVLALIEQARGGAGAYGTTADAQARLPELPETRSALGAPSGGGPEGSGPAPSDGGGDQ
ncbi:MAG TPA: copper transporter [Candidatus Brachybacterium merdavium]|uniref:Copper transporter n=1 Tax=Candidatus Brachybacterium merdavium TaxID=2838513 RepID=A0A9D2LFB6_9MICO|nr:copper transporter [Candidatus Brachybacterium merdavium]